MKLFNIIYLVVILLSSSGTMRAQSNNKGLVKLTVIDAKDKSPIADVHVSVLNSTKVVSTDKNGNLEFKPNEVIGKELLLTHVSYESTIFYVEIEHSVVDTILMSPESVTIEDVVVKSKKSKNKKKWLKTFRADVFGPFWKSRQMKIENEEDILFTEKSDSLVAYGNDVIMIENKKLGYKLRFILQNYIHKEGFLRYKGMAWFEDLKVGNKKVQSRREKSWRFSSRALLQSVLTNSYREAGFECEPITNKVFKINLDGIYAAILPNNFSVTSEEGISTIHAKEKLIIFNNFGEIINRNELKFSGYWDMLTVSDLLPSNFKEPILEPSLRFDRSYSIGELRAKIDNLRKSEDSMNPIEAIELVTDKQFYLSDETAHVSASLIDLNLNSLTKDQQLIYFELYDIETKSLLQSKCSLTNGGKASQNFDLVNEIGTGQYQIVAYTDYMSNFSVSNLGRCSFAVNLKHDQSDDQKYLQWFPEGGNLIVGKSNRVVFKVTDAHGNPVALDDNLLDEYTGEQKKVKTLVDGIGTFQLTPSLQSNYTLENGEGKEMVNLLDPVKSISLSVINSSKEFVSIQILSSESGIDLLDNHKITVEQNGNQVFSIDQLSIDQVYKFSRSYLPQGTMTVHLYNAQQQRISSRTISNSDNTSMVSISPNYAYYYNKQAGQIKIDIDSTKYPIANKMSWAVSLRHIDKLLERPLLLNDDSELANSGKSYINDLKNIAKSNEARWDFQSIQKDADIELDRGIYIKLRGKISDLENELPLSGKVDVSSLAENFYFDEIDTDSTGVFSFEKIPFLPNASYIVQARKKEVKKKGAEYKDRNLKITIDSLYSDIAIDDFEPIQLYKSVQAPKWVIDTTKLIADIQLSEIIDEVTIEAEGQSNFLESEFPIINGREWHKPLAPVLNLAQSYFPNLHLMNDREDPSYKRIRIRGGADPYLGVKFYINIDGYVTRNIHVLQRYVAEDIVYIGLGGSTLNIVTTPAARYKRIVKERSKGVTVFTYDHLMKKTKFQNEEPNLIAGIKDNRSTLYWNPEYKISDDEEIKFYTSDIPGDYIFTMIGYHPELGKLEFHKKLTVAEKSQ